MACRFTCNLDPYPQIAPSDWLGEDDLDNPLHHSKKKKVVKKKPKHTGD